MNVPETGNSRSVDTAAVVAALSDHLARQSVDALIPELVAALDACSEQKEAALKMQLLQLSERLEAAEKAQEDAIRREQSLAGAVLSATGVLSVGGAFFCAEIQFFWGLFGGAALLLGYPVVSGRKWARLAGACVATAMVVGSALQVLHSSSGAASLALLVAVCAGSAFTLLVRG